MIGRIAFYTALAAVAFVAATLQIDFRTRTVPGLAAAVPEIMRNYAQVQITQQALAGKDGAKALAEARKLVERRPLPAEYLTLLSAGQAKAGRTEDALQTIQIAGRRGWREPLAQEAVLRLALAAGDKPEAARRYAALFLRERTPDKLLEELGPAVLGEAGSTGQQTLVAIVVGGERWHPLFLRRGARVMPPAAFSAIAVDSLARGAAFDCRILKTSIGALERRDAGAAANLRAAALERCPKIAA